MCGVADVIVETMEGLPLAVGEVKSGSSRAGTYQLLAAAYFLQQRKGQWVLGKYCCESVDLMHSAYFRHCCRPQ